jgi:hypothetical protein
MRRINNCWQNNDQLNEVDYEIAWERFGKCWPNIKRQKLMYGKGNKCLLDLNKGNVFEFIFWCVRLVMAIIFALEIMGAYHDGLCDNVAWCWCASLNK